MYTICKFLLFLILIHNAVYAQSVVVHWDNLRQTIDGFGASDAWFADEIMTHPDKDEMLDLLFSRDKGAGLSILRHHIPPNPADWIDYQPDLVSGDLDFGTRPYNGVRFTSLNIPQGAAIDSAWIQFQAKDNLSLPSRLTLFAENTDNALSFTDEPANISGRLVTSDSLVWEPPAWLDGARGAAQKTPDLKMMIQEIVNRPGWIAGSSMVFIIKNLTGKRSASAFERNPDEAAQLIVYFDSTQSFSKRVIAGSDDAEEFGISYISYGAGVTKEAFARGCEKVWAAAWSPPAIWKTNGILSEGGFLMQEHYQDWADFIENYRTVMDEKSGFPLYAISPQNEPGPKSWESCQWNSGDFRDFIKSNLGPTLDPDCRIIVPEETNWNNVDNFYNSIHNDPVARDYVDIVAGHVYGGDPNISYNHFGKHVWETEWSYNTSADDLSINNGVTWAYNFWRLLVNAEVSACHHWWLVNMKDDGRQQGLISAVPYTEGITIPKRLWTIGNFSKFVRPGWKRIEATKEPLSNIYVAAFKNVESGEFAFIVINNSNSDKGLLFSFKGFQSPTVIPHRTSSLFDLLELDSVKAGDSFIAIVPTKSVTTYVGLGTDVIHTGLDDKTDALNPASFELFSNYPNPFNPVTMISYQLPKASNVELAVYNMLGHKITDLVNKKQSAGTYQVQWNASGLSSGIYMCRLTAGKFVKSIKLILVK